MAESKTELIYQALRKDLIELRYDTAEPINEKALAEQYGVSKTPVREALAMLVQEGYLRKYPRLGYVINGISEEEYYKLNYLRYTLEKGVIAYIISNSSDEEIKSLYQFCQETEYSFKEYAAINLRFHFAMADLTHNEFLIASVRNTFERARRVPSKINFQRFLEDPHGQHKALLEAMLARDLKTATVILRDECRRDDDIDLWF